MPTYTSQTWIMTPIRGSIHSRSVHSETRLVTFLLLAGHRADRLTVADGGTH